MPGKETLISSAAASVLAVAFTACGSGTVPPPHSASIPHNQARHVRDVIGGALPTTTVNVMWDEHNSNNDWMSTVSAGERTSGDIGQSWYIPRNSIDGTKAVYRLYNGGNDHMDSMTAGEGGYSTEEVLGYAFTGSTPPGTQAMARYRNTTAGDHDTPSYNYLPGYPWSAESFQVSAWPRYDKNHPQVFTTIGAGGISADVNAVAGAAFWNWRWNGYQFLQSKSYGGLLQSALFYQPPTGTYENPTEAGDDAGAGEDEHGSPVALLSVTNGGANLSTRAVPMESYPARIFGQNTDWAIIYKDIQIGKDVTFNWNGMGPVVQYLTKVYTPNQLDDASPNWPQTSLEMPTAYLNPFPGSSGAVFYGYDAVADSLYLQQPTCGNGNPPKSISPHSGIGGVVVSSGDGSLAMGIYGRMRNAGGQINVFPAYDQTCLADNNLKISASTSGTIPAGWSTYTAYVVTGTRAQVQSLMHSLYLQNY